MYLLLNTLSRLVISFLPRSKCLLISWLQSPSAVSVEPPKIRSDREITFKLGPLECVGIDWIGWERKTDTALHDLRSHEMKGI